MFYWLHTPVAIATQFTTVKVTDCVTFRNIYVSYFSLILFFLQEILQHMKAKNVLPTVDTFLTVLLTLRMCRRIREMEVFKVLNEMKAVNIGECIFNVIFSLNRIKREKVRVIVFNATFNNISVISWWSVLLVE